MNETTLRKIIRDVISEVAGSTSTTVVDVVNADSGEVLSIPSECPDDVFEKLRALFKPLKSKSSLTTDTHVDDVDDIDIDVDDGAATAAFDKIVEWTVDGLENYAADAGLTGRGAVDDAVFDMVTAALAMYPTEKDVIMRARRMTRRELIDAVAEAAAAGHEARAVGM